MNNKQIVHTIVESAKLLNQDYNSAALNDIETLSRKYHMDELNEFKRDLTEAGNKVRIIFLDNTLPCDKFQEFLLEVEIPLIVFEQGESDYVPCILYKDRRDRLKILTTGDQAVRDFDIDECNRLARDGNGDTIFMGVFAYKSLVSEEPELEEVNVNMSPVRRLFRLLSTEKKEIVYIYIYAVLIGLVSLTLPLGIQATVELISGGVFFTSVYVLMAFVILGTIAAGALQITQITLVEFLQRRIFTKAAFEFAFRVPRIKIESLHKYHAPELINRFFDILTIQKGLPKLFIDLSAGIIQIIFGLLLLSFYHPLFVFFGIFLTGVLFIIFYFTGPKGLASSITESKYKYKVAAWLEELARTINSFKLSGNTELPVKRTEYNVNSYLKNRKIHFRVLIGQYSYILLFKAAITGAVLVIGTFLVIQREITLGQFVAAEVIIVLTLSSVEKIIMYMDVVYDLLTAVDKVAQVTDLPLDKTGGIDLPRIPNKGYHIKASNVKLTYPSATKPAIKDIDLDIQPGERICIAGGADSGKTTLMNTISGLNSGYEGVITYDQVSLRDLDLINLRDKIGKNVSSEDIFDGTILENILVGKPNSSPEDALWAIQKVGLADMINGLPDGLHTHVLSGGKGFSSSFTGKLILARCLAKKPNLLILNDFFGHFPKCDKLSLIEVVTKPENKWTLISISNDPLVMAACDRILVMDKGTIAHVGTFEELMATDCLNDLISKNSSTNA